MKKVLLIIFVLILSIGFVVVLFSPKEQKINIPSPTPYQTPTPTQPPSGKVDEIYNASFEKLSPQIIESDRKSGAVGAILDKLPIQETNLLFSYDINKNIFTAVIDSSNKTLGLMQLDAVLKANGIDSRSWIENLEIIYK